MEASSRPVLLVEDDPESRTMLTLALECEGYGVIAASNGVEALALAQQHQPALILLDLMMPVMGGKEFRTRQLQTRAIRNIPVVIVSARYDAGEIAHKLQAVGCIGKPIDFDALTALVARAMTGARGQGERGDDESTAHEGNLDLGRVTTAAPHRPANTHGAAPVQRDTDRLWLWGLSAPLAVMVLRALMKRRSDIVQGLRVSTSWLLAERNKPDPGTPEPDQSAAYALQAPQPPHVRNQHTHPQGRLD